MPGMRSISEGTHTLAVTTDNVVARYNLGPALQRLGRTEEAIDAFSQAVRLNPSHTDARVNLTMALCNSGRYAEAWEQARICEQHGVEFPADFLEALSRSQQ